MEHSQTLQSSLNFSRGVHVKVGSLYSDCDTSRKLDPDETWPNPCFKQPLRVHAAKPERTFVSQVKLAEEKFEFTSFTTKTCVAIISPCCSRRALVSNWCRSFCLQWRHSKTKSQRANWNSILYKNNFNIKRFDCSKFFLFIERLIFDFDQLDERTERKTLPVQAQLLHPSFHVSPGLHVGLPAWISRFSTFFCWISEFNCSGIVKQWRLVQTASPVSSEEKLKWNFWKSLAEKLNNLCRCMNYIHHSKNLRACKQN